MVRNAMKRLIAQALPAGARGFASGSRFAARAGEEVVAVKNTHHKSDFGVMDVPSRLLMGPGPANAHPRVLAAQTLPLLGHMHPQFLAIMDQISKGLQYTFQTDSKYSLMISGTGHAGMEASIANLLEPGEKIIVGNAGIWGARVADLSDRFGAQVIEMKKPAGGTFSYTELKEALTTHKPAALFLCQVKPARQHEWGIAQNIRVVARLVVLRPTR